MAIVKGINEIVHLPLYDSLFVRPGKQLKDRVSSNVLKFFVNIHGKTKLETNMQASSLLPHWNTFEARALRVVISDLPEASISDNISYGPNGNGNGHGGGPVEQLDDVFGGVSQELQFKLQPQQVEYCRKSLDAIDVLLEGVKNETYDYQECVGRLQQFCHSGDVVKIRNNLKSIESELAKICTPAKAKSAAATAAAELLLELDPKVELEHQNAIECLHHFAVLAPLLEQARNQNMAALHECVQVAQNSPAIFQTVNSQYVQLQQHNQNLTRELARCKAQRRRGQELLGKLLYNSVTTLFVGEKIMIQMPTWFFPAGAGPYSENGQVVTNGFPTPQATFNFAEPVTIDTQQNFRVELEIPEGNVFEELQQINGPFFIWVVLDGYMKRDVQ